MKRILLAFSGGVDSAAAALLLQAAGHELTAVTMLPWLPEADRAHNEALTRRAKDLAEQLHMPHHLIDLSEDFKRLVIAPFIQAYHTGQTPNPCIGCNQRVKFGLLFDAMKAWAEAHGLPPFDAMATGHYAQLVPDGKGDIQLLRGLDQKKDQSYFLYRLSQMQLQQSLFPLGALQKEESRAIVAKAGLQIARKEESQDICFIHHGYQEFLAQHGGLGPKGHFVSQRGEILGEHPGIAKFTIGQRKKLGIALGTKMSVLAIDPETATVTLGQEAGLFHHELWLQELCFNSQSPPELPLKLAVALRYHQPPSPALLRESGLPGHAILELELPLRAPAAGQSAVFYQGDRVIGGGIVCRKPAKALE